MRKDVGIGRYTASAAAFAVMLASMVARPNILAYTANSGAAMAVIVLHQGAVTEAATVSNKCTARILSYLVSCGCELRPFLSPDIYWIYRGGQRIGSARIAGGAVKYLHVG
jgi:hypothetical protein